jgi:hypothetical protein
MCGVFVCVCWGGDHACCELHHVARAMFQTAATQGGQGAREDEGRNAPGGTDVQQCLGAGLVGELCVGGWGVGGWVGGTSTQ